MVKDNTIKQVIA